MSISFGWYCHHYHHLHANVDAKIALTLSFILAIVYCLSPPAQNRSLVGFTDVGPAPGTWNNTYRCSKYLLNELLNTQMNT